jgi:AraC-like DNA-binding protein
MSRLHAGRSLHSARLPDIRVEWVSYDAWARVAPHVHELAQIGIVVAGEMLEIGGGERHRLPNGHAVIRPEGWNHENRFYSPATEVLILEPGPTTRCRLASLFASGSSYPWVATDRSSEGLVRRVLDRLRGSEADPTRLGLEGAVLSLLGHLVQPAPAAARGRRLRSHGLHARLETAQRLLAESTLDLAAVAQEAGFYDQAHLTRAFRAACGLTPAQYRRRERG